MGGHCSRVGSVPFSSLSDISETSETSVNTESPVESMRDSVFSTGSNDTNLLPESSDPDHFEQTDNRIRGQSCDKPCSISDAEEVDPPLQRNNQTSEKIIVKIDSLASEISVHAPESTPKKGLNKIWSSARTTFKVKRTINQIKGIKGINNPSPLPESSNDHNVTVPKSKIWSSARTTFKVKRTINQIKGIKGINNPSPLPESSNNNNVTVPKPKIWHSARTTFKVRRTINLIKGTKNRGPLPESSNDDNVKHTGNRIRDRSNDQLFSISDRKQNNSEKIIIKVDSKASGINDQMSPKKSNALNKIWHSAKTNFKVKRTIRLIKVRPILYKPVLFQQN